MKTHQISRRALAAGLALASVVGLPALADASKLDRIIQAHRLAKAAFDTAVDDLEKIEDAYDDAYRDGEHLAPNLMIGGGYDVHRLDRDECRKMANRDYESQRQRLDTLAHIAPDIAEKARAAIDAKEAENMALIDKAFEEDEARKEAFGLAEVQRRWEMTNDAETEAATALCSYHCKTVEEARIRAEYILQTPLIRDAGEGEYLTALLQSFIPAGAGDRVEA